MNEELRKLQQIAQKRLKLRKDPQFIRVIRALETAGLLVTNEKARGSANPITFDEIDFAGRIEPRVFEVLPALAFRRPATISNRSPMPEDLKQVIYKIERNETPPPFRGVEPKKYLFWINHLRKSGSHDRTISKIFRFSPNEVQTIKWLKQKLGAKSESDVLRIALQELKNR